MFCMLNDCINQATIEIRSEINVVRLALVYIRFLVTGREK